MARVNDGRASDRPARLPSEQELAIIRNHEARSNPAIPKRIASGRGGYAATAEEAVEAASLMDRSRVVSPFAGLPTAASVGQFKEAAGFYGDLSDEYYDYEQSGYGYDNLAGQEFYVNGKRAVVPGSAVTSGRAPGLAEGSTTSRDPAPIQVVPTSTTNPQRPRTVAAGYDGRRGVLTVVFRDGTFYNYYSVDESEWEAFKAEWSKGLYIRTVLDFKPRGTARMASSTLVAREGLYRIARTGQWVNDGQVAGQIDRSKPFPRLNPTKSRRRK